MTPSQRQFRKPFPGPLPLAVGVVLLDQLSKGWAREHLPMGVVRPLLPGLLELQRVANTGAAFSLFQESTWALGVISLLVSMGLLLWLWRQPPLGTWQALAIGFLLGGAVGNGIDRWRHGAVVDFLSFVPISFPIFNLADMAINIAVLCFALHLLTNRHRSDDQRDA